jgi:transposase
VIVIAAQRPGMRFVVPKSEDQQALAVLFRARKRLVHQRTELVNALLAVLYEFGHVVPQGIGNVKLIDAILVQPNCDLPALARIGCADLAKQIAKKQPGSSLKRLPRRRQQHRLKQRECPVFFCGCRP